MKGDSGPDQFSQDELIPISAIADLVFCERRAALHFLECIWHENLFTAEGTLLHDKVHETESESRGDIRIVRGLRLRSLSMGLSGVADVVEFHRQESSEEGFSMPQSLTLAGAKGLWAPFPVEYKRGKLKHEISYEIQLCAQAICLEEMLNVSVPRGAIFYGKSMRRHDVSFTTALRKSTEDAARRMHSLIGSAQTPKPIYGKKCESCSIVGECLPKSIQKKRSVQQYLARITKDQ